jgi:hypothetical protein
LAGIISLELLKGGVTFKELNYLGEFFEVIEMVFPIQASGPGLLFQSPFLLLLSD